MRRIARWTTIGFALLGVWLAGTTDVFGQPSPVDHPIEAEAELDDALAYETQPPRPRRGPRGFGGRRPEAAAAPAPEKKEEKKDDKPDDPNEWLVIKNADVYTITDGVETAGTIVVKNGRIHEIGRDLEAPAEDDDTVETIDATGMRVYPGLIALNARRIVGRSPVEDTTDPFSLNFALALGSGVTSVLSGNEIAKLTYGSIDSMSVGSHDWVTLSYSSRSPSSKRQLRKDLDRVREYFRDKRAFDLAKKRGDDDAEEPDGKFLQGGKFANYKRLLSGESFAHFRRATSAGDLLAICQLCEDYGIRGIVDEATEAWTVAPALARAGIRLVLTPQNKSDEDESTSRATGSSIENARILHDHGVRFAITQQGSGISLGGQTGRDLLNLPMAAAFAIRGGLSQDAALEAITIEPARLLGIDDQLGSIERGKDADLIIVDGDLLHYETMVQWAIVNGKIAYDKEKEPLFRHIRPRGGEPEDLEAIWPIRWIDRPIHGVGPGAADGFPLPSGNGNSDGNGSND